MLSNILIAIKGLKNAKRVSESRGEIVTITEMHPYWCINTLKKVLNDVPANNYEELIENEEIKALCMVILKAQKSDIRKVE